MSRETQDAQVAKQAAEQIAYNQRKRNDRQSVLIDGAMDCPHHIINGQCVECEGIVPIAQE